MTRIHLTIVSRIYDPEPSAASYFLRAVARRAASRGHEVTVLTTRPPANTAISDPHDVRVKRARVLRDRGGYVRGYLPYLSFDVPLAVRILFGRRADVYLVEPPPTTGAVVRVVTALLRRPYVYDTADIWSDAAQMATGSSTVIRLLRWVERFALRGAAEQVTISQGVVGRVRELGIDSPMTVVGFGADTATFRYTKVLEHDHFFVYAGNQSEWQGADIFVDAFARFSQRVTGYRLLFIGSGSERELIERRASELGLTEVEFRDPIPGSELTAILSRATASLASVKPGVGYDYAFASKVYSSMAAGCPVVFAGPGPTGPFLVAAEERQRTGFAVDYDPESVSVTLQTMVEKPFTSDERMALSEWTSHTHSMDAVADRVVEVAERVAAERS